MHTAIKDNMAQEAPSWTRTAACRAWTAAGSSAAAGSLSLPGQSGQEVGNLRRDLADVYSLALR